MTTEQAARLIRAYRKYNQTNDPNGYWKIIDMAAELLTSSKVGVSYTTVPDANDDDHEAQVSYDYIAEKMIYEVDWIVRKEESVDINDFIGMLNCYDLDDFMRPTYDIMEKQHIVWED